MVVHIVGDAAHQRRGHKQSSALVRGIGAEWREPLRLPPHECLVPVLHHYHSDQPRLRDHIADPAWAAASDVAGQPREPPPQRDDVMETREDERRCGAVQFC